VLVVLLAALLIIGIRETAFFTVVFTLIEAGGLIFLIVVGLPWLGSVDYLAMPHGLSGSSRHPPSSFLLIPGSRAS
jgi:APA family basic amino acid/polyamine antiporter